ncbi:MAG: TonB-dependent receptor [Pseudomonadales bacterium]
MRLILHSLCTLLLSCMLLHAGLATAATTDASIEPGERLADALEKYRVAGFRLVWSSGLINDRQRVFEQPAPGLSVEAQLNALLEPHALRIRQTADGSEVWYVVRLDASVPEDAGDLLQPQEPVETTIEEILVISPRHRLVRGTATTRTLDISEIQGIPAIGRDLLRVVNTLPGQADNGFSVRQRIRGGDQDEVLYLLDGARVIEPFHLKDFLGPFSALNTNVIDTVDVYRSGFPASYGNRSSAVMEFGVAETSAAFSGMVDANLLNLAAHMQGATDNWQWLASARRGNLDTMLKLFDTDYGEPSFDDQMLRLSRDSDHGRMIFGLLNVSDEASVNNPSIGESGSSSHRNTLGWLSWQREFSRRRELNLHADFSRVDSSRGGTLDNPADAVGSLVEDRDFDVYRFGSSWRQQLASGLTLLSGFEYEHQRGTFSSRLFTTYGPLGEPIQPTAQLSRAFDASRDGEMAAVYVTAQTQIGKNLEIEFGLRYDNQDMDPIHDNRLSPRLQINYALRDDITLFANAGRYVQHQNLYELQIDDGLLELQSPQAADQYSAGFRFTPHSRLQLQLEVYHKSIDNPQTRFDNLYNRYVLLPELHSDRVQIVPESARASGVEISASGILFQDFFWRAAYVYSDVEEKLRDDWRPRPWDQHQAVSLGFDWQPGQWRFGLHSTWHTGWATTPLITEPLPPVSFYDSSRLKDFASIDVSIARIWQMQSSRLELYLDISNVSNRSNVGGFNYELDEDGDWQRDVQDLLPLVPVLGLRWEW